MTPDRNASKPRIVVLGGINMDIVANVQRMPEVGETVHGDKFFMTGGGKGANQAVAAARLGAEVRMVGRVGDDDLEERCWTRCTPRELMWKESRRTR